MVVVVVAVVVGGGAEEVVVEAAAAVLNGAGADTGAGAGACAGAGPAGGGGAGSAGGGLTFAFWPRIFRESPAGQSSSVPESLATRQLTEDSLAVVWSTETLSRR